MTEVSDTYDVAQAAAKLGVSADMVYQRVAAREWPCLRFGRKIRFDDGILAQIRELSTQHAVTRSPARRRTA